MKYKLRIVNLAGGECRIQKKHWLLTLGFWTTITVDDTEYLQCSKERAERYIKDYYQAVEDNKVISYKEYKA